MNGFEIPDDLIQAIQDRKCILFVGAGLSQNVKRSDDSSLPGWKGLLEELLEFAKTEDKDFVGNQVEITKLIEDGDYLTAAQELRETVSPKIFQDYFDKTFGDPNLKPYEGQLLLPQIPFRAILTTNYDKLLENAYKEYDDFYMELKGKLISDFEEQIAFIRESDFFILKINGNYYDTENMVFGTKDYNEKLHKSNVYKTLLKIFFAYHLVLFIGTSLEDPGIKLILDELAGIFQKSPPKHYALFQENKISKTMQKRYKEDYGIETITYPEDKSVKHKHVTTFIKELIKSSKKTIKKKIWKRKEDIKILVTSGIVQKNNFGTTIIQLLQENGFGSILSYIANTPLDWVTQRGLIDIARNLKDADVFIPIYTNENWESPIMSCLNTQSIIRDEMGGLKTIAILIKDKDFTAVPGYFYNIYIFRDLEDLKENFHFIVDVINEIVSK